MCCTYGLRPPVSRLRSFRRRGFDEPCAGQTDACADDRNTTHLFMTNRDPKQQRNDRDDEVVRRRSCGIHTSGCRCQHCVGLTRIIHEGADSSRDTKASAWYKAVATRAFSHTEAFDCATTPYHRLFFSQTSSTNPSSRRSISPTRVPTAARCC